MIPSSFHLLASRTNVVFILNGKYETLVLKQEKEVGHLTHPVHSEGRRVDEPTDVVIPLVRRHSVPQL